MTMIGSIVLTTPLHKNRKPGIPGSVRVQQSGTPITDLRRGIEWMAGKESMGERIAFKMKSH